jgi:hypothetical protein
MTKLLEKSVATKTSKTFSRTGRAVNDTPAFMFMRTVMSCLRTIALITPSLHADKKNRYLLKDFLEAGRALAALESCLVSD